MLALVGFIAVLLSPAAAVNPLPAQAFDYSHLSKLQKRLLSGLADLELRGGPSALRASQRTSGYLPTADDGCSSHRAGNIKVNQNCIGLSDADLPGRGQAMNEPFIAQDPGNPDHLVASFNDYRAGEGTCGTAYSRDGGQTWTDSTVPNNFTRGTAFGAPREYWQTGGDGTVAFDTRGNAYLACHRFQRGPADSPSADQSSAVYVFRSTGNGGASWNFPGRPVIESSDVTGVNGGFPFEDKPVLTVDSNPRSPYRDRIYVTYTEFNVADGIITYESYSDDYGEHFSPRVGVFNNASLCTSFFDGRFSCDAGVDGQPFVGPDGTLYVVQENFNNGFYNSTDNHNQVILARSSDGGRSFFPAVKVADYYDLPDCGTYQQGQDGGRSCVPEKGATTDSIFRAINYATGAVNQLNPRQVAVAFGSYINPNSNESTGCFPAYFAGDGLNTYSGVKAPGTCNNDILLSVSNDGGQSFSGGATDPRQLPSVTQAPGQALTDQFWEWAAFQPDGTYVVSYYDRQYGNDETTGYSDVSLSTSRDLVHFAVTRVTTTSMPPPTQFEATFFGDYAGLSVSRDASHTVWSDTRDPELFLCPGTGTPSQPPAACTGVAPSGIEANNQSIFTASIR